jgi:uncharacterized OB-fold protein
MAVRLLKELLAEKLEKASRVSYPERVVLSYCKVRTNSVIEHTPHGVVRRYVVTEV